MRRHLSSILGYGLSVVLSALVTLLTIPVIIGSFGSTAWASLAVSQAIGTGAAIVIGYGWGTTGPTAIARAEPSERITFYADSFRGRLLIAGPILAVSVIMTLLTARAVPLESVVNALGYGATGLLAGWYFTGVSRPYSFLSFDTAPRVLGAAIGAAAVLAGAPLVSFTILQLLGVVIGIVASTRWIVGGQVPLLKSVISASTARVLRGQSHGIAIALVAAAWSSVPISIVAVFAPSGLAAYALVDKLLRFGTTAYAPIVQFLQGWVPAVDAGAVLSRIRKAFAAGGLLALVGAGAFAALGGWFAGLLSHEHVTPAMGMTIAFGTALLFTVMSQVTGLVCLLALDRAHVLARASVLTVIVGLPIVILGAIIIGADGAAWCLATAEGFSLVLQLRLLVKNYRVSLDLVGRSP